jgi:hypothetical protein
LHLSGCNRIFLCRKRFVTVISCSMDMQLSILWLEVQNLILASFSCTAICIMVY